MARYQTRQSAVQCPVCSQEMEGFEINSHLDHCLGLGTKTATGSSREESVGCGGQGEPGCKKARLSPAPGNGMSSGSGRVAAARSPAPGNGMSPGSGREAAARSPAPGNGMSSGSGREAAARSPAPGNGMSSGSGREAAARSPAPGNGMSSGSGREAAARSPALGNRKQAGSRRATDGAPLVSRREDQPPVFALFQKAPRPPIPAAASSPRTTVPESTAVPSAAPPQPAVIISDASREDRRKLVSLKELEAMPLAEIMRPCVLAEIIGQSKVLGENTLLRTLLESYEIPSIILWGPPGCGKTSLAHVLANNSRKQSSTRFVSLSAANATVNNVREVIKQAQNEQKLLKRKTIIFLDEIHRFNKTQQDTFLPHVECGTITLIGATTENPSFQINAALLSRCRVIVLEKLSVEAMETILLRALSSLGISILGQDKEADSMDGCKESEVQIFIEPEAVRSVAYFSDGDARAALNGLHLAIQAKIAEAKKQQNNNGQQSTPTRKIIIKETQIKEGLQRSHLLYDRAGEEHYNCISALHKTMRASDEKSALYWLARMLEGGEDPLYVARRLIRFASEDIGLADPLALTQAVSAYQGCHFIGMPECEVILAQCVAYLARAPKSVEIYRAYEAIKESVRNHKGPLPSVPLHLRNAPTKLMKDLGYGKGYKYPPDNKMEDGPCTATE
ncbi:ATPase WRNIP1 [Hemitrygon akajei]|uniref:ATPase WRNIP1 n=1 Tax=Hemitrygon akajei TaxID=2704970 RepID=UPI003BF96B4A